MQLAVRYAERCVACCRACSFGAYTSTVRTVAKSKSAASLKHASSTLHLSPEGALQLAIVADTHSQPHPNTEKWLRAMAPDAIVHAGDIGDLAVLEDLAKIAPVIAVRGNIDERAPELPDAVCITLMAGDDVALKILLMHIAVYGPKLRADAARLAGEHGAKLVICGHSHVPFIGRDRGLTLFNPGSIGPRRMHLPILFGELTIANGKLSLRHRDAETGESWLP
jgi:putative phosphoesterase